MGAWIIKELTEPEVAWAGGLSGLGGEGALDTAPHNSTQDRAEQREL